MSAAGRAISFPGPVQRQLEETTRALLQAPSLPAVDFSKPTGEPALVPADSVCWRLFKNPITLLVGGVAAVLLELAEPRVRDGVWQNSSFRTDPLSRLQRTGLAAMVTVYGARSTAERMIAGVVRAHERVKGRTTEGLPYSANEPELLDWVQATASFGFIDAYSAYARPLSGADKDQAYREGIAAARLYGAAGAPTSRAKLEVLFEAMDSNLVASPIIHEFVAIMESVPAIPGPARPLQRLLVKAGVELLPEHLQRRLGLDRRRLRAWERPIVAGMARMADRLILRTSPAVQSCRRLGLPDDYLYRS